MVRLTMSDGKDRYIGVVASTGDAHRMISALTEFIQREPDGTRLVFTVEPIPDPVPTWRQLVAQWFHETSRWVAGWGTGTA